MTERTRSINIDAEAWRRELEAIGREVMNCQPSKALERIEALRREVAPNLAPSEATTKKRNC